MLTHAKDFLRPVLVKPLRAADQKPFIIFDMWSVLVPTRAKACPKLCNQPFPNGLYPAKHSHRKFGHRHKHTTVQRVRPRPCQQKKKRTTIDLAFKRDLLKKLCGQRIYCDDTVQPDWYISLLHKHQDKRKNATLWRIC